MTYIDVQDRLDDVEGRMAHHEDVIRGVQEIEAKSLAVIEELRVRVNQVLDTAEEVLAMVEEIKKERR